METTKAAKFKAIDPNGNQITDLLFDTRDAAAGACQDASREAGDDGEGYSVVEVEAL